MTTLTWNLQWASPGSRRAEALRERIRQVHPDVVCCTEVIQPFAPSCYAIESDPDYGYARTGDRRKVVLWSRTPWLEVDPIGDSGLPSGRFVSGVTQGIRFVGVCIPWRDAHVRTGRRDRAPWQDHVAYCEALGRILKRYGAAQEPLCVIGDYNQRIPRVSQPDAVYRALHGSLAGCVSVATEGLKDAEGKCLIDHVAVSPQLRAQVTQILPRISDAGMRLSDHVGIVARIERRNAKPSHRIVDSHADASANVW